MYLAHAPYDLFDDRFGYKLVSRADGGTETDFVHACKHGNEAPIFFGILESNAADLCHGFTDKSARHDRVAGEMSLKKRFVDGDGFHSDGIIHGNEFGNFVYQQHRITMGEDFHDFFNI